MKRPKWLRVMQRAKRARTIARAKCRQNHAPLEWAPKQAGNGKGPIEPAVWYIDHDEARARAKAARI